MTEPAARIHVLGPISVEVDGRAVPLGGVKPKTLLAALLARVDSAVSTEALVDLIWGAKPPASARAMVQTYASTLRSAFRKAGAPDIIVGDALGYRADVEEVWLDRLEFENALRRAQASEPGDETAEILRSGLELWRGPAFGGLGDGFLRAESERLEELRLTALDLWIGVELDSGAHERLIPQLRGLVAEHPLRESFAAALMLALAAAGRQSAALAVFEDVRTLLREEFGSDPGPRLREAHEIVLRDEPPVQAATEVPMQLPADLASFSGRGADLLALDGLLPAPGSSAPRTLVIVGQGGIGKTALAVHWAHRVRDRFPDGQLFVDLRGYDPVSPVSTEQALTRCLRALGVTAQRVPATLDEQVALHRSLLAGKKVLLVLDNVAGATQVRPLLPPDRGCVAVVTSRDDLRGLTVSNDARVHYLDVLTPESSRDLLAELCGSDLVAGEPQAVEELTALCGYLPLALRIAAANLLGRHARISEYVEALRADRLAELEIEGDPSVAVRAAFHLSYQMLDPDTRQLFRLLGRSSGPDITAAAAAELAGRNARRSLERLVSASLLTLRPGGRYQFHDLVREYAADRAREEDAPDVLLAAETRLLDHYLRTASAATALYYPGFRRLRPVEVAEPGPFEDGEAALRWLDDERANLVAAAERAAATPRLQAYGGRFVDVLRGYFSGRGYAADGLALCAAAMTAARASGDRQAEVAVHALRGLIFYFLSEYDQSIAEYTAGLEVNEQEPNPIAELECLHHLGRVDAQLGRPHDAMRHHQAALEIARRLGDETIEAREINYIGVAHLSLGQIDSALSCHTLAQEISARIGDKIVWLHALNGLGLACWTAGRLADAARYQRDCMALCEKWGLVPQQVASLVVLAETCGDLGLYDEAEEHARKALELGRKVGERRHEASALELTATVIRRRGHPEDSIAPYTEARELAAKIGFRYGEVSVLIGLSAAHRAAGRPGEAVNHIRQAQDKMNETGMGVLQGPALIELAAAHLALGEVGEAAGHAVRALEIAVEDGQRLSEARALAVLGQIRLAEGDSDAATGHWRAALELFTDIGAPEAAEVAELLS
ncbi:tetratricopeptide repeat protein [Lentzea alba]|uniref:AfsR/SARP family transcriptional regulator n=1 Tax=Lentzea alba TaxID=2714351 RepID=UPI0039BF18C4